MIIGSHLIWTAYGWWLPNDPRGSESHEIRVEKIAELGELHHGRKKVQPRSAEIRRFYRQARDVLDHPLLTFNEEEVVLIAASFGAKCSPAPISRSRTASFPRIAPRRSGRCAAPRPGD